MAAESSPSEMMCGGVRSGSSDLDSRRTMVDGLIPNEGVRWWMRSDGDAPLPVLWCVFCKLVDVDDERLTGTRIETGGIKAAAEVGW